MRRLVLPALLSATLAACTGTQPQAHRLAPAPAREAFTFTVLGDSRPGNAINPDDPASPSINYLDLIAQINRVDNSDFAINVGDFIRGYNAKHPELGDKQWAVFDRTSALYAKPFFMVAGNHDIWDEPSANAYRSRYGDPYYAFSHHDTTFIALCTELPGEVGRIGPKQLAWLEAQLAKPAAHRFVFLHEPLWSDSTRNKNREDWMKNVHPLLVKYHVDAVFGGHDHFYEPNEIDGIRCIVTGGGGAEQGDAPELGDFYHFLTVAVPATGPAEIQLHRDNAVFPWDVIPPGTRGFARKLQLAKPIVLDGQSAPAELSITNTLHTPATFTARWLTAAGQPATTVQPSSGLVNLTAGQTVTLPFTVAATAPLKLDWELKPASGTSVKSTLKAPCIRTATFAHDGKPGDTLTINSADQLTGGRDQWQGPADSSATATIAREPAGLRIAVDVTDDVHTTNLETPWDGDSVEIYLDTRPAETRGGPKYDRGVFQVILIPDPAAPVAKTLLFKPTPESAVPGATAKTTLQPHGYRVELFLPNEGLAANHVALTGDSSFNFSVGINDADKTAKRRSQLMWSGTGNNWATPAAFGHLKPAP